MKENQFAIRSTPLFGRFQICGLLLFAVLGIGNISAQENVAKPTKQHEHLEFIPGKHKDFKDPNQILKVNLGDSLKGFDIIGTLNEAEAKKVTKEELPHFIKSRQNEYIRKKYYSNDNSYLRIPENPSIFACNNESFETGSTAGWSGFNGFNTGCTPNCTAPTAGATTAIVGAGIDACAGISTVAPGGGTFSCQLGNDGSYGDVNAIQQSFVVSAGQTMFTYQYAIVLENPVSGHIASEMPYFSVEVRDGSNNFIPCGNYDVQYASGAANFTPFSNGCTSGFADGIYRDWTTVTVDLGAYIGQTITIRYIVSGCGQGGHFGYAYIDANCSNYAITGATSVCNGLNATLTAPAGMGSYAWTGPGIVGATNGQTITANAAGTYSCTMVSIAGCPVPGLTHTLTTGPSPVASFTNNTPNCNPTFSFTDVSTISSGSITGWAWDFGDAGATSATQSPNYTFTTPGTHTVTLTTTSDAGCVDTYTSTVVVEESPTALFNVAANGGAPLCPGVTMNFTDASTSPNSTITAWSWNFGDPASGGLNTSASQNPSHVYASANTYPVTFTVTNAFGCTATTTQNVVINANPVPAFTSNQVCLNTCTQFTNNTPATPTIATWAWDFTNDGASDNATQAPCFTYTSAGTFTAELTATSTDGCVGTITSSVIVNPNPVAAFTASTECVNDATQFDGSTSTVAAPDNIAFYNWTFGDASSASGLNVTHTYAACGTYTANLVVVSNNNCTNNTNVTVTVNCRPLMTAVTSTVVCPATAIPASTFTTDIVGSTFDWTNNNTNVGLAQATGNGNVPGFNTVNSGSTQLDATISVTPTSPQGCPGNPITYTISVLPTPVMNSVTSATYCPATFVNGSTFSTVPTGSTFTWTNSDPTIGLAANGTGQYASFNTTNSGSTTLNGTVSVTPTLAGCVGLPTTYTITVNPTPVASVPASAIYCPNDLVPATGFTSVPTGSTFNWTNTDASIGIPANGIGQISAFNAANTSAVVHAATISVTPTLNNCVGLPVNYTITVNPTPYVNATSNIDECPAVGIAAVNLTSTPAGATMTWVHTNSNVGLSTMSGNNNIPAFTTANGVSFDEVSTVTITPTLNNCIGPDSTYTITVRPTPTLALPSSVSYCPNVTVVPTSTFSTTPLGATINWTNNNTSIGLPANGVDNYNAFVPLNTGSTTQIATINATPTLNGCVGPAQQYSITVFPKPVAVVPASSEVCPSVPVTGFSFSSIPNDPFTSYSWMHDNAAVGLNQGVGGAVNTASTNNFSSSNNTSSFIVTTFTVTTELNGCYSDPVSFSFSVNPLPTPNFTFTHTCEGDVTNFTSTSTVGTGSIATYQWDYDNNGVNENSSSSSTASTTLSGFGTFNVNHTVITDKSCVNNVVLPIYVNPNPVPTITVNDPDGCPDHSVVLSGGVDPASVDHNNSILTWDWDYESNSSNDTTHNYASGSQTDVTAFTFTNSSPIMSQFYQVTLTATSDSGCVGTLATSPVFITVYANPVADFEYGPVDPGPGVEYPMVDFFDQSQGASNWSWSFNDPLSSIQANSSTLQNPQHFYENYQADSYDVTLIINNGQCWDTVTKPITIRPDWTFFIPNAFSPNSDGINDGFRGTGVGIEAYGLYIFDRWGLQIWYSNDLDEYWDGAVDGKTKPVQEDVYVWKVKFKDGKGTKHEFEGTVTVVR